MLKTFPIGQVGHIFGSMDVLPNGNVLIPQWNTQKVMEFDANGREVWQSSAVAQLRQAPLPNGNTLVCSMNTAARHRTEPQRPRSLVAHD